jgi:hypothetical protein
MIWALLATSSALWPSLKDSLELSKVIAVATVATFVVHAAMLQLVIARLQKRVALAGEVLRGTRPTVLGIALLAFLWLLKRRFRRPSA